MKNFLLLVFIVFLFFGCGKTDVTGDSDKEPDEGMDVYDEESEDEYLDEEHDEEPDEEIMCSPGLTKEEWESEEWKNGDDDEDGIPNWYECPECPCIDSDGDSAPDYLDLDSDGDTIPDSEECPEFDDETGCRDTDGDGTPDYLDLDSDGDGLSDKDEKNKHGTDPYNKDTDGDGTDDFTEIFYGSDPIDPDDTIPPGIFYVVLPYNGPSDVTRTLTFGTKVESIDVLFFFDDSGSMEPYIENLKSEVKTEIMDVISEHFKSTPMFAAYGLAMFGWDNPYEVYQHITFDENLVVDAMGELNGDQDDEMAIPALYLSATGEEFIATLKNCLPPPLGGCDQTFIDPAQYNIPGETCEGQLGNVGGACFRKNSMPIYILISDEPFMDCVSFEIPYPDDVRCMWDEDNPLIDREIAVAAMNGIGAKFIGVDTRFIEEDGEYQKDDGCKSDFDYLAQMTASVDADGENFNIEIENPDGSGMSTQIVEAIMDLITFVDMDITIEAVSDEDCWEENITQFLKDFKTLDAYPTDGISHKDDKTFFSVTQGTEVSFELTFYNDFCPDLGNYENREFKFNINLLGNGKYLGTRLVHVVIPSYPKI